MVWLLLLLGIGLAMSGGATSNIGAVTCEELDITPGESYEIHIYATSKHSNDYVGEVSKGSTTTRVTGLAKDYNTAREELVACVLGKGAVAVYEVHHLITTPGATVHTLYTWDKPGAGNYRGLYETEEKARAAARDLFAKGDF